MGRPKKTVIGNEVSDTDDTQIETLADALMRGKEIADDAEATLVEAAFGAPEVAASEVAALMKDWEDSGAAAIFTSDRDLVKFYRTSAIGIYVRYIALINRALSILGTRLDDKDLGAPQLLALTERFSDQIDNLRNRSESIFNPSVAPETSEELDKRLAEMEARLQEAEADS